MTRQLASSQATPTDQQAQGRHDRAASSQHPRSAPVAEIACTVVSTRRHVIDECLFFVCISLCISFYVRQLFCPPLHLFLRHIFCPPQHLLPLHLFLRQLFCLPHTLSAIHAHPSPASPIPLTRLAHPLPHNAIPTLYRSLALLASCSLVPAANTPLRYPPARPPPPPAAAPRRRPPPARPSQTPHFPDPPPRHILWQSSLRASYT